MDNPTSANISDASYSILPVPVMQCEPQIPSLFQTSFSIPTLDQQLAWSYRRSKMLTSDESVKRISEYICLLLEPLLSDEESNKISTNLSTQSNEPPTSEHSDNNLLPKVYHFFRVTSNIACLILSEMIFAVNLVERLIKRDLDSKDHGYVGVVNESNLGTLLLCSIILSVKMNRDTPFTNRWWTRAIGIPVSVINQSELVFLDRLNYTVWMDPAKYIELYSKF